MDQAQLYYSLDLLNLDIRDLLAFLEENSTNTPNSIGADGVQLNINIGRPTNNKILLKWVDVDGAVYVVKGNDLLKVFGKAISRSNHIKQKHYQSLSDGSILEHG